MSATGKSVQFPRSFGRPWVPGVGGPASAVGISAPEPLVLERDPSLEVPGNFVIQRGGNSSTVCQVGWRVEGLTTDPVLPEHFTGGALPSGIAFFGAGVVEVSAAFLVSPGLDPARESRGRVLLENPLNCTLAAGRTEIPLSLLPNEIVIGDAIVSLDVGFSVIELDESTPTSGYALGPDYETNWTLHQADPTKSTITQEDNGVVLAANDDDGIGDIFLFAKLSPPAKWALSCKYTWLDGLAGNEGGTFTRFGYVRGKGSDGIEANPNLWSAADAGDLTDPTMDENCNGIRASINTRNSGGMAALSNQVRVRIYDPATAGTPAIDPDDDNTFTFVDDIEYDLQIKREGSKMTFSKSAPGTLTQVVSFTDADEIGSIGTAWIFWGAVNGRRFRVRDLTLVELP
jgi:hypothetical protein